MKRKLELLPPVSYEDQLKERLKDLNKLIKRLENKLQANSQLKNAGKIRIVRHGKTLQFYLITKKGDTRGTYLPRTKDELAQKLIEFDYYEKVVKAARKEQRALQKLIRLYEKESTDAVFRRFSPLRKELLEPVTLTGCQYAIKWLDHQAGGKDIPTSQNYYTTNGEYVRSKSEIIIANTLSRLGIPYVYEKPVVLQNDKTLYPDFCCLNLRTREEVYWEHFGMMDDENYITTVMAKLKAMQKNGYRLGKNLIFTMEKPGHELDSKYLEELIQLYLT